MQANDPKALIRAHYDAMINAFDPDAIRAQVAEDYFDHQTGRPMPAEVCIAHAEALHASFAPLTVTLDDIVAEGDRVAVRGTWRGVHAGPFRGVAPTGRAVAFTGMVFWRVRDGKVAERWAEVDFARLVAQLGQPEAA
ncbi:MAG: ester cyclase [Alphaproteobacteria bacterium]|nr:ester cyclase [Alphaproteobacteria bacterium]